MVPVVLARTHGAGRSHASSSAWQHDADKCTPIGTDKPDMNVTILPSAGGISIQLSRSEMDELWSSWLVNVMQGVPIGQVIRNWVYSICAGQVSLSASLTKHTALVSPVHVWRQGAACEARGPHPPRQHLYVRRKAGLTDGLCGVALQVGLVVFCLDFLSRELRNEAIAGDEPTNNKNAMWVQGLSVYQLSVQRLHNFSKLGIPPDACTGSS